MDIAEDRGYTINGTPTAFWPIGYPGFLALHFSLFGPSLGVAKVANVVLYIGVLYLSYAVAKRLFSSEMCGRLALGLLAFYPNHIAYSSLVATETLFLFLLLLGVFLLMRSRAKGVMGLLSGVVFGLAVLVKTYALLVPLVILASWIMLGRRRSLPSLKNAAILYLALGLTVSPWVIRNYKVFGGFMLSNNDGLNLLYGNNPYATGTYNPAYQDRLEPLVNYTSAEYERNRVARRVAINYMMNHPVETVKLWPRKLFYLYNEDGEGFMWNRKGMKSISKENLEFFDILILVDQVYYILILGGFIVCLPLLFRRLRKGANFPISPLMIMAYFTFISLLTIGHSRLHFPLMPWMAMYAAWTANILILGRNSLSRAISKS